MTTNRIVRPTGHDDSVFIVNVSGGKDSTATIIAMREAEVPCLYVFADTGWEMPQTYEYLAYLERKLSITIDRVGLRGGMIRMIKGERSFPNPRVSWCTDKLKIRPLRRYFENVAKETDCDTVSVVGIRGEESARRAEMPEFQFDDRWGGYVWRPIMGWLIADVLAAHHRHGVDVNPLYRLGFDRVGCAPCKNSTKSQIELFATLAPERIALLRGDVLLQPPRRHREAAVTGLADGADPAVALARGAPHARADRDARCDDDARRVLRLGRAAVLVGENGDAPARLAVGDEPEVALRAFCDG
jgi:3'-phosphoadenosine 5'-phosphosulfate sulfotransferase (PAPS reductase)/FAD synthetase